MRLPPHVSLPSHPPSLCLSITTLDRATKSRSFQSFAAACAPREPVSRPPPRPSQADLRDLSFLDATSRERRSCIEWVAKKRSSVPPHEEQGKGERDEQIQVISSAERGAERGSTGPRAPWASRPHKEKRRACEREGEGKRCERTKRRRRHCAKRAGPRGLQAKSRKRGAAADEVGRGMRGGYVCSCARGGERRRDLNGGGARGSSRVVGERGVLLCPVTRKDGRLEELCETRLQVSATFKRALCRARAGSTHSCSSTCGTRSAPRSRARRSIRGGNRRGRAAAPRRSSSSRRRPRSANSVLRQLSSRPRGERAKRRA